MNLKAYEKDLGSETLKDFEMKTAAEKKKGGVYFENRGTFGRETRAELSYVERDGERSEEQLWSDAAGEIERRGRDRGRGEEKVRDSRIEIAGPVLSKAE